MVTRTSHLRPCAGNTKPCCASGKGGARREVGGEAALHEAEEDSATTFIQLKAGAGVCRCVLRGVDRAHVHVQHVLSTSLLEFI